MVWASRLRVKRSAWSRYPLKVAPAALWGSRLMRFWLVYVAVPRLVLKLPHENGVARRPTLTMTRLVLALILFLMTLKYGLSTSLAAVSPVRRRRRPDGVR